jgi:hypothetical protein
MQACAAQLYFLDNRDIEAELLRADGGNIPAGASAQKHEIELLIRR